MKASFARLSALVLAAAALPLHAQDVDKMARLDPTNRYAVESLLDSANALSLPSAPLLSVVYQGIAHKADGRRIVSAVRQKLYALKSARQTLGNVSEAELSAAADVLQAGVRSEQLGQFRSPSKGARPLTQALVVLGDLITRGVPVEEASSTIAQLWQRGAGDADFYGLWHGVEEDILQGQSPGAALQQRAREFPGRGAPSKLPPNGRPETPSS